MPLYGSVKHHIQTSPLRKAAYAFFGEVHVPGRLRAWHVIRTLRSFLGSDGKGKKLLDAGSGRGDLALYLAGRYPRAAFCGLEYDGVKVSLARRLADISRLGNVSFAQGDICEIQPDMGSFDIVTCCDVLEHIPDDKTAVRNFHRMLAPEGILVLTFPSLPQRRHLRLVKLREKRIGFRDSDYGHVRQGYSEEGISQLLEDAGFRDVICRQTFGFWGTLCFDLFFVLGDNKPTPALFLCAFPLLMLMASLDLLFPSGQGSGMLVTAHK